MNWAKDHPLLAPLGAIPHSPSVSSTSSGPSPISREATLMRSLQFPDLITYLESLDPLQPNITFPRGSVAENGVPEKVDNKYSLNMFHLLRTISNGSFGRVRLVISKRNQKYYALQILSKAKAIEQGHGKHIRQERDILSEIKHPFIGKLWGTFQDTRSVYMVMNYFEGGKLSSLLQTSKVRQTLAI